MSMQSDLKWLKDNIATKNDLKLFVKKSDLKNVATKDDLKKLSTKNDLRKLEKRLNKKFTDLFDYLDRDVMTTKSKVSSIEKILQITAN